MSPLFVTFLLTFSLSDGISGNVVSDKDCSVPAVCENSPFSKLSWIPMTSLPSCEIDEGIKGAKGEMGDIGPGGEKGSKGEPGPAGIKGKNGTRGEQGRVDNLIMKNIVEVLCPVRFEDKCFMPVIGRRVDYDEGSAICESLGGYLANIYNQTHMDDVMSYVRNYRMQGHLIRLLLGMEFDPMTSNLTLRDGTEAAEGLKWACNYPNITDSTRTGVILRVKADPGSERQYLRNVLRTHLSHALCEVF